MPEHSPSTSVFLADDSLLIRERVAALLVEHHMTIVGEAATPQGSIDAILAVRPDVVVLDVQLEGGSGLQVLRAVRQSAPEIAFVVFSNAGPAYSRRYLDAGATEFLDKNAQFDQLATAVGRAAQRALH